MDAKSKHPKQLHRHIVRNWSGSSAQRQMLPLCVFLEAAIAFVRLVRLTVAHQTGMVLAVHGQHGRVVFCHQQRQLQNQLQLTMPLPLVIPTWSLQPITTLTFAVIMEFASLAMLEFLQFRVNPKCCLSVGISADARTAGCRICTFLACCFCSNDACTACCFLAYNSWLQLLHLSCLLLLFRCELAIRAGCVGSLTTVDKTYPFVS